MIRLITLLCSLFCILQLSGSLRAQDTARYEWDLTDIYADASDWQSALDQVADRALQTTLRVSVRVSLVLQLVGAVRGTLVRCSCE